ncbi:MAG TPA: DUF3793 family protein [Proteobacteria bacterium]|nr:DUF3793 family protein [Pseudomonadota bacterium]
MHCLKEYQATDFHKLGNDYLMITRDRECLHFDRDEKILARKQMTHDEIFKFKLIYHLAATMVGIKPLTIMRFKHPPLALKKCASCAAQWQELKTLFQGRQTLGLRVLECNARGETLLFYHREACHRLLGMSEIRNFLEAQGWGYGWETIRQPHLFIDLCIKEYRQKRSLPVELGLFMGIPLKDVKGYIAGDKQQHLLTAGWQIYGRRHPSLVLANLYRRLRRYAMLAFFQHPFETIVERLGRSRLIERLELLAE